MDRTEQIKMALDNLLKVYSPAELLALSARTLQIKKEGWGEVKVTFVAGVPMLLLTEISDKFNRADVLDDK